MAQHVAILEDDIRRIVAMRNALAEILPGVRVTFFDIATPMISFLRDHVDEIILVSLDHDLPVMVDEGKTIDYGTGRQVVDYLAPLLPTCPVIIHSSNDSAAAGMYFKLKDAGWSCDQIRPYDDLAWIAGEWAHQVRHLAI